MTRKPSLIEKAHYHMALTHLVAVPAIMAQPGWTKKPDQYPAHVKYLHYCIDRAMAEIDGMFASRARA